MALLLFPSLAHAQVADLAITKTDGVGSMMSGGSTTYTVTVTNNGPNAVTGAILRDAVATGLVKTSISCGSPAGQCTAGTTPSITQIEAAGGYALPALASGQTYRLSITATATATSGTVTNTATITAPGGTTDAITGNNSASDANTITARSAGTPPTLSCPVGSTIFDWDTKTWADGTTNTTLAQTGIGNISFAITNPTAFLNLAAYGGQSPSLQSTITGGLSPVQLSLIQITDFANTSQEATTTITLPTAVPGAQFRIFDIDHNAGQYADRITVTGSFNGVNVTPTLTNGIANYVIGNSAYGDALSSDTQANGNIVITFSSPVDTITFSYGNHSLSPANPGQQAITLHDITFCNPQAVVSSTKISTVVSDGVSASNPKAIPGAILQYCITVNNAGSGTATTVSISDALPANTTYIAGSMLSGGTCGTATTAEDDNNTGADESDPIGMSITGTTITATRASMLPSTSFALTFNATVN